MNRTEYIGKLNALYVGEKNCLEELITAYDEKNKEIERLKGLCDKYEEEHKTTFEEWKKAINIIKEVRDILEPLIALEGTMTAKGMSKLLGILDKGSDEISK